MGRRDLGRISQAVGYLRNGQRHLFPDEGNSTGTPLELTDKEVDLVKVIKQVQEVTLTTLESAVSFISGPKAGSQPRGWSLVSRMLQSKTTSCKEQSDNAGIQKIEAELLLLKNKKPNQENDLLKQLGASDENIQELVEILEVVFRLLLKIRVSLLNILNH